MFKYSVTVAALTSSVSAFPADNKMSFQKSMNRFSKSGKSSTIQSAAAVSGTWLTVKSNVGESCSFTASNSYTTNIKMGECIGVGSVYYKRSCTSDGTDITVTNTEYSDNTCSTRTSTAVETETGDTSCSVDTDYTKASCSNSPDNGYDGQVTQSYFSTQALCESGSGYKFSTAMSNGCEEDFPSGSSQITCDGGSSYDTNDCSGTATITFPFSFYEAMNCVGTDDDGDYAAFSCSDGEEDAFCFHVDSKINYKGVEFTYEELKAGKEPECTVPHSPSSKGVVVSTSCGKTVRVTDTHLLATTKGFQLAFSLKAGDVLFGDYDKELCTVKSVEKEKTVQQYFGLNCVHSEVLASGIRASTFGDFHTLPAWYMTYVGGLLGTETASSLGEYVAEWYFKK